MTITDQETVRALAAAAVNRTKYGYADEFIVLDGSPFSFDGHNYLVDMYNDHHKYIVIEKSAQMGASVYAMVQSFFVCDKLGLNTIYFFPTDTDVQDFAKTRVRPIIQESPHLREVASDKDSLGLRQVGRGWLYFRGMKSNIAMKSIPGDCLVFDELDEVTEASEALADQRLNHSRLKWRLKLSTPTFAGYGIDREFLRSDQRYWNLVCKKCGTNNILEKQFPECVRRIDELHAELICRRCAGVLDTQYGVWIPEEPKNVRIRGYHLCGLYSSYLDLAEMMDEYESGRRRQEFFRSKLGIPYTSVDQRMTPQVAERCRADYEMPSFDSRCYMGVDQKGDGCHIVIRKREKYGTRCMIVFIGHVKDFKELDAYMRKFDVAECVIDGTPNQHSARDFANRFKGRVHLCYYNDSQKGDYTWTDMKPADTKSDWKVDVNRTESLDDMYEEIALREVAFPKAWPDEWIPQLCNLAKVNEVDDDNEIQRAVYKKLGEDHYAHANNYSLIAYRRYDAAPRARVIQTRPATIVRRTSRQYEMGSPY